MALRSLVIVKGADGPRSALARFLRWAAWRRVRGGKSGAGMLGLGWATAQVRRPGFPVVLGWGGRALVERRPDFPSGRLLQVKFKSSQRVYLRKGEGAGRFASKFLDCVRGLGIESSTSAALMWKSHLAHETRRINPRGWVFVSSITSERAMAARS